MSQIKFLSYLNQKGITPTEYASLYVLTQNVSIGDGYNVDYDHLYNQGFLSRKDGKWIPTSKTKNMVKFTSSLFNNDVKEKEYDENTLNTLVDKLQEVYPKKTPQGRSIRSNKKDVKDRLIRFFMAYSYSHTTVIEAVTRYLDEQINSTDNGKYLRELRYLILKGTESKLADYCQDVLDNPVIQTNNVVDHRFKEL